ncbi:response regulator [Buchananella hordeovulneris]|uniref:DNA-binding response regulator n=1 Tax=Buchananella hordeovulneris TaxID=52770 RepID=A0A1Q5PUF5_9ACTO|nr:response regulator transcription factor [Buchananella hordeovulneris]OKL51085.1 DNA-binding response regulator [Buchananella hordeovulneris]
MTSGPRVLVVDDQELLRHSFSLILDSGGCEVVGQAATGRAALELARQTRPDVVLMDIRMPDGDGIAATAALAADPVTATARVLVLTMFELDEYVVGALRAGAAGFLLKDTQPERLVEAVRRVAAGESLVAPQVLTRLIARYVTAGPSPTRRELAGLTPREVEVLRLVAAGRANSEIAVALGISSGTLKTHIGHLLAKLQARDRAQLVIAAYEAGLVVPQGR